MLNISQVILMRTDSNLCRKELTVHWGAPNSLIKSYLQPCTNSMWGDESEAVAPIIWLYQIVNAQKEEVFFPGLLITLRCYVRLVGADRRFASWDDMPSRHAIMAGVDTGNMTGRDTGTWDPGYKRQGFVGNENKLSMLNGVGNATCQIQLHPNR